MYCIFPVPREQDEWMARSGHVFFTWCIVNPNGPTLNAVGIRNSGSDSQLELFWRWMHFLGGETYVLGYVDASQDDAFSRIVAVLRNAFTSDGKRVFRRFPLVTCIPNVVTLPDGDDGSVARALLVASPAVQAADWGSELYYREKYGSDWIGRAGEQTRAGIEAAKAEGGLSDGQREFIEFTEAVRGHLAAFRDWKPNQFTPSPITDAAVSAWWAATLAPEFVAMSLAQFAAAWVGSSEMTETTKARIVEPFEHVRDFVAAYGHALWPESLTTDKIRDSMEGSTEIPPSA